MRRRRLGAVVKGAEEAKEEEDEVVVVVMEEEKKVGVVEFVVVFVEFVVVFVEFVVVMVFVVVVVGVVVVVAAVAVAVAVVLVGEEKEVGMVVVEENDEKEEVKGVVGKEEDEEEDEEVMKMSAMNLPTTTSSILPLPTISGNSKMYRPASDMYTGAFNVSPPTSLASGYRKTPIWMIVASPRPSTSVIWPTVIIDRSKPIDRAHVVVVAKACGEGIAGCTQSIRR